MNRCILCLERHEDVQVATDGLDAMLLCPTCRAARTGFLPETRAEEDERREHIRDKIELEHPDRRAAGCRP